MYLYMFIGVFLFICKMFLNVHHLHGVECAYIVIARSFGFENVVRVAATSVTCAACFFVVLLCLFFVCFHACYICIGQIGALHR